MASLIISCQLICYLMAIFMRIPSSIPQLGHLILLYVNQIIEQRNYCRLILAQDSITWMSKRLNKSISFQEDTYQGQSPYFGYDSSYQEQDILEIPRAPQSSSFSFFNKKSMFSINENEEQSEPKYDTKELYADFNKPYLVIKRPIDIGQLKNEEKENHGDDDEYESSLSSAHQEKKEKGCAISDETTGVTLQGSNQNASNRKGHLNCNKSRLIINSSVVSNKISFERQKRPQRRRQSIPKSINLTFHQASLEEQDEEERRYPLRFTRIPPLKFWIFEKIDYKKKGFWTLKQDQ